MKALGLGLRDGIDLARYRGGARCPRRADLRLAGRAAELAAERGIDRPSISPTAMTAIMPLPR